MTASGLLRVEAIQMQVRTKKDDRQPFCDARKEDINGIYAREVIREQRKKTAFSTWLHIFHDDLSKLTTAKSGKRKNFNGCYFNGCRFHRFFYQSFYHFRNHCYIN